MPGFTVLNGEVIKLGIWAGDIIVSNGRRFRVDKIAQVNYKCTAEDGSKWNVRIHDSVVKAEDQTWDGPKEKNPYELLNEAIESGITLGTVVKLKAARLAAKYPGNYVCVAMPSDGTFRLAKLGGDGGRYLRKITADMVEVVNL